MQRGPLKTRPSSPHGSTLVSAPRPTGEVTRAVNRWQHSHYRVRRKFLKMVEAVFYVDTPDGNLLLYANQKAFKLKEDLRLYTGEDMKQEVLTIKRRITLDFGATYDIVDAQNGQCVGSLRRKAPKSLKSLTFLLRDEWHFLDAQGCSIGMILEDSQFLALLRRVIDFATYFLPQSYHASLGNSPVAVYRQTRTPSLIKIIVDFTPDKERILDRRLGIAVAVLLCAIEGKRHALT